MNSSTASSNETRSELEENIEALRATQFFSGLPLEVLKLVAYLAVREEYESGETVFRRGDDEGRAYLVLSGHLRAGWEEGGEILCEIGPGDLVGALSLLGPMPRRHCLTATESARLLTIEREPFAKAMSQFPRSEQWMLEAALGLIRGWGNSIEHCCRPSCAGCRKIMGVTLL